jgi:hypothetical protein
MLSSVDKKKRTVLVDWTWQVKSHGVWLDSASCSSKITSRCSSIVIPKQKNYIIYIPIKRLYHFCWPMDQFYQILSSIMIFMMDMYDIYDVHWPFMIFMMTQVLVLFFQSPGFPPLNLPSVGLKSSPEVAVPSFVLRPTKNPTWNIM